MAKTSKLASLDPDYFDQALKPARLPEQSHNVIVRMVNLNLMTKRPLP